jgi:hypothetical protein
VTSADQLFLDQLAGAPVRMESMDHYLLCTVGDVAFHRYPSFGWVCLLCGVVESSAQSRGDDLPDNLDRASAEAAYVGLIREWKNEIDTMPETLGRLRAGCERVVAARSAP